MIDNEKISEAIFKFTRTAMWHDDIAEFVTEILDSKNGTETIEKEELKQLVENSMYDASFEFDELTAKILLPRLKEFREQFVHVIYDEDGERKRPSVECFDDIIFAMNFYRNLGFGKYTKEHGGRYNYVEVTPEFCKELGLIYPEKDERVIYKKYDGTDDPKNRKYITRPKGHIPKWMIEYNKDSKRARKGLKIYFNNFPMGN